MSVTIYGYSDDLIEVEGDIEDEFSYKDDDKGDVLSFSNGTVLRIEYSSDGLWKIVALAGAEHVTVEYSAIDAESSEYSDRVMVDGDISWVTHGSTVTKAKAKA